MKHAISQDVFEFIKGKDILHELIHSLSGSDENIPPPEVMDSQPQVMNKSILLQDIDKDSLLEPIVAFDSLLEDMDSLLELIALQDFDMDSLLEPIVAFDSLLEPQDRNSLLERTPLQDFDMDSLLEPMDSLIDSLLGPIDSLVEDKDSMLEPIVLEDRDSMLEPITFDSLSEPNVLEDKDSLLEPITFNKSLDVDECNEILCRLDSILEPVVVVDRCSF